MVILFLIFFHNISGIDSHLNMVFHTHEYFLLLKEFVKNVANIHMYRQDNLKEINI